MLSRYGHRRLEHFRVQRQREVAFHLQTAWCPHDAPHGDLHGDPTVHVAACRRRHHPDEETDAQTPRLARGRHADAATGRDEEMFAGYSRS